MGETSLHPVPFHELILAILSRMIDDGFKVGSIRRIRMEDFLTYTKMNFKCGRGMNFVLGPNGSGKSSLVCAICLGLAGRPEILFRAPRISNFVRHGQSKGLIEIELQGPDDTFISIQRIIYAENEKSEWKLNGSKCTQQQVKSTILELEIDIENLCNFLPQERVASFAQLSSHELLLETMSTVGGKSMVEDFKNLSEISSQERNLEKSCHELSEEISFLDNRNAQVHNEVQRYLEHEKILEKIDLLETKRPWVEYNQARDDYKHARQVRNLAQSNLKELQEKYDPIHEEIQSISRSIAVATKDQSASFQMQNQLYRDIKAVSDLIKQSQKTLNGINDDIDDAETKVAENKRQLEKNKAEYHWVLESIEEVRSSIPDHSELDANFRSVRNQLRSLSDELNAVQREGKELYRRREVYASEKSTLNQRLQKLKDVRRNREMLLARMSKDTFEALNFVRQNRKMFRRPILGPILLELDVEDPDYADYVEAALKFNHLLSFVCQSQEDYETLMRECNDVRKLRINAVEFSDKYLSNYSPRVSREQLRDLGFEFWVLDLLRAPEPVVVALCELATVHTIPISSNSQVDSANAVNLGLKYFIAGGMRFTGSISRYGNGQLTSRSSKIQRATKLVTNVDDSERGELEEKIMALNSKLSDFDDKIYTSQERSSEILQNIDNLKMEKERIKNAMTGIKSSKNKLAALEGKRDSLRRRIENHETIDVAEIIVEMEQKRKEEIRNRAKITAKYLPYSQVMLQITSDIINHNRNLSNLNQRKRQKEEELLSGTEELEKAQDEFDRLTRSMEAAKEKAKLLLAEARKKGDPDEQMMEKLSELPNTLDDLDRVLASEKAKAELNVATDPQLIEQYNARRQKLVESRARLSKKQEKLGEISENVNNIKEQWYPRLQNLIDQINQAFSRQFRELGCTGEIRINEHEMYEKWGLEILVKFRDSDPLAPLNAHRQSGGEKSVTIITYLLSLQEMSKAPFRVVDEINQGMDPRNERMVHGQMVKKVCENETSQYFLISPKLLPDLEYHENMRILSIYNGNFIPEANTWNCVR